MTNGTTYDFIVRTDNQDEDGNTRQGDWSETTSATVSATDIALSAPRNLETTAGRANRQVEVSWQPPANDGGTAVTNYKIRYRPADDGPWTERDLGTRPTLSASISDLDNGVEYQVELRAENTAGSSSWTMARATPEGPPDTPQNLTLTAGVESITASWEPPDDNGAPIFYYVLQYRDTSTDWTDWNERDTGTSATITGLTPFEPYEVRVRAVNTFGKTGASSFYSDTEKEQPLPPPMPPEPPVVELTPGNGEITLTWTVEDNGADIDLYRLLYQPVDESEPVQRRNISPDDLDGMTYTLSGLTNGVEYEVQLRARNEDGFGEWSEAITATPMATAPDPPVVTLTPGDGQLTLTWTVDDNGAAITQYRLLYQPEGGDEVRQNLSLNDLDSPTSYTLTGLTNGTPHQVRLKSQNQTGFSDWSEAITGTPGTAPTRLEPMPTAFTAGVPQMFTLHTDESTNLWVGVNYDGNNNLTTGSCPAGGNTGAHRGDGDTITIRGCYAGEAEIRIYRGQLILASYDVTVSSSGFTASLADVPSMIDAGGSETFTLTTNVSDFENVSDFVWVGVNYGGDNHLSTGSCPAGGNTGALFEDDEVTIYGCSVGEAEIRIYRGQLILNSYTVSVTGEADTASLSPAPSSMSAGGSQTLTLSTNIDDGVWVGVNYDGNNHLSTGSCPAGGNTGVTITNGQTVTINACSAGTAEIRLYKLNTLLATYEVTVSP